MAKIRLWKLGSLEHQLLPSEKAIQTLHDILQSVDENAKTADIIWGPEISVEVVEEGELEIISIPTPDFEGYKYIKVEKK